MIEFSILVCLNLIWTKNTYWTLSEKKKLEWRFSLRVEKNTGRRGGGKEREKE